MTEKNRASVELVWDSDGFVIDAWESFTLRETYIDPLGDFSFTCRPPRKEIHGYRERLAKGAKVECRVNGATQGKFLVQDSVMRIGATGVTLDLRCQSPLCTPYQGGVDPQLSLSAKNDVPVTDAILQAFAMYGFTEIVADATGTAEAVSGKALAGRAADVVVSALKGKELQAQHGETAYQFAHRVFSRLGVQLRIAVDGRLLLEAPDYEQTPAYTVCQSFRDGGPIGDYFLDDPPIEISSSNDNQFSECVVIGTAHDSPGKRSAGTPRASVAAADVSDRPAYSSTAAPYKPKFIKDKNARDVERCGSVAKLGLTMGCEGAFSVTGTVDGLVSKTGRVWAVGTMARVYIEAYGLDEPMFLLERTMRLTPQNGQTTSLKFIPKNGLILGDIPE